MPRARRRLNDLLSCRALLLPAGVFLLLSCNGSGDGSGPSADQEGVKEGLAEAYYEEACIHYLDCMESWGDSDSPAEGEIGRLKEVDECVERFEAERMECEIECMVENPDCGDLFDCMRRGSFIYDRYCGVGDPTGAAEDKDIVAGDYN